jgi:hypothetical protein
MSQKLSHYQAKEFCRIASELMVDFKCFLFVANNKLYLQDKKNRRIYDCGAFYDGMHFTDLSVLSDEELDERVMPWK